ncbi:hypothetical protein FOA43_004762 [Brettanomyces nanus]|uniref:Uncharacterized protein n=1 Tax=Eeniella nana TaxID=13502 RepID=A0A875RQL2_EENNA|nr:uncharacterized protein FOA43_004762 [Brettanomyces nanus]QPG77350.1 hypothetical protein FOA43_004762 [Brettanomyces nanus]
MSNLQFTGTFSSVRLNGELDDRDLLNVNLSEPVSILNVKHRQRLLETKSTKVPCPSLPDYIRFSKEHNHYKLQTLLEIYLRNMDTLSYGDKCRIISVLLAYQWFHNASVIISQMNISLDELLTYINRLLRSQPVFRGSSWMKFQFLLELHFVLSLKNSFVISQLDFLQMHHGYNLTKLKFMNSLIQSTGDLPFDTRRMDKEIQSFYEVFNDGAVDLDILGLRAFLLVDLIKATKFLEPSDQVKDISELIEGSELSSLFQENKLPNFVGSFGRHVISLNDYERTRSMQIDCESIAKFIHQRKNMFIKTIYDDLLKNKESSLSVVDYFNLVQCAPNAARTWDLYKCYSLSKTRETIDSFYTPLLIGFFADRISNENVFMDQEFSKFSPFRKSIALTYEFRKYVTEDNGKHYDRFVYFLGTIKEKYELEQVISLMVNRLFMNNNGELSLRSTLKFMKMVNRVSNLSKFPNDPVVAIVDYITLNQYSAGFFEGEEPEQRLQRLIKYLLVCDKVKAINFLPILLNWTRRFHTVSDLDLDNVVKFLFTTYNQLLNESVQKQPQPGARNKEYVSQVYLSNKFLLRRVATELLRCDNRLSSYFLDHRIQCICKKDPKDFEATMIRRTTVESIIIEFLVRTFLRTRPRIEAADCNLGIDSRIFFEIQGLLDSATLRKVFPEDTKADANDESSTNDDLPVLEREVQDAKLNTLIDAMLDSKETPGEAHDSLDMANGVEFDDVYNTLLSNAADLALEKMGSRVSRLGLYEKSEMKTYKKHKPLSVEEKLRQIRLYCAIRLKSLMIEELISQEPELVDHMVRDYYRDYRGDIPLALIHSIMLGVLKCKRLAFEEKIEKFKNLEKLGALIFDSNKSTSFRRYVRFKEVHIALINTIIDESSRTNSGSLDILSWGFKKFINTPNVGKYSPWMKRWMKRLNLMREQGSGFWNDGNTSHSWEA